MHLLLWKCIGPPQSSPALQVFSIIPPGFIVSKAYGYLKPRLLIFFFIYCLSHLGEREPRPSSSLFLFVWSLSCVQLFCDPWEYSPPGSQQEYWSGLPFPSPDLPDPEIIPNLPHWKAESLSLAPPVQ